MNLTLNGYVFFFAGRRVELRAATKYEALLMAVAHFKPTKAKAHLVHGELAELGDTPVTLVAVD